MGCCGVEASELKRAKMKTKIQFTIITIALLASSGCMMSAKKIKAIASDQASWTVHVTTPWGSAIYVRQAPANVLPMTTTNYLR
jgi:uncharacterized protein (DUF486 family)